MNDIVPCSCTLYQVELIVLCIIIIIAKLLIAVPTKPVGSLKASWNHDGSVLLSWQPLSLTEARGFPLYIVSYKSVDGSSRGSVNTTSSSIAILGLNSKVGYMFLVLVSTGNGKNKGDTEYSKEKLYSNSCV